MTRDEYRRLHSAARYTQRKACEAYESDSPFYRRNLADGRLTVDAITASADEAVKRLPGGLPRQGLDPLLRLQVARRYRHGDRAAYDHLRFVCAASRHVLRLIDAAVGCELASRRAVKAIRSAA